MARRAGMLPEFSTFHEVGVATVPSESSAHGTVVGMVTTIVSSSADAPAPPSSAYAGAKGKARHHAIANAAANKTAAARHIPVIART